MTNKIDFSLLKKIAQEEPKPPCKGLFFRGSVNVYHDGKGRITEKKEIRLLKRKSCEGCEDCFDWWDYMSMCDINEEIGLSHIEHGKLYTPICITGDPNWETGIVDEWWYEFQEVKD